MTPYVCVFMRKDSHVSADDVPTTLDLEGLYSVLDEADICYAVLFGSYVSGTESSTSDIDICIRFDDGRSRRERFRERNRIDAVAQSYADPFVDISDVEALPEEVALDALQHGTLLYGDPKTKRVDERRLERTVTNSSEQRTRRRREFIDRLAEGDV